MPAKINPDIVRALRKHRGWSQGYLAAVAGIGESTVKRIERGPELYSGRSCVPDRLAEALGVSVDVLANTDSAKKIIPVEGDYVPIIIVALRREHDGKRSYIRRVNTEIEDIQPGDEFVAAPGINPSLIYQMKDKEPR